MNELISNPFGQSMPAVQRHPEVESTRAVAEVQAAMTVAKRFPRNQIEATDRILGECQRPGLAEQALYSYARGGTEITGPSIRLAEAIARNWENLEYGVKELSQENGQSEMMAFCWDLEKNVRNTKIFNVKHERHTKSGNYKLTDPRDIYETSMNSAARRLRSTILATIPGDIVDAAVAQCEQTLKAKADTSPDALKKLVEAFDKYSVTKEQIEQRIQRRLDTITPAQLIQLRKIYNSLKDGMSSSSDWFQKPYEIENLPLKAKLKNKIKELPKPPKTPGNILCPKDNKGVVQSDCESCSEISTCNSYQDYLFDAAQMKGETGE